MKNTFSPLVRSLVFFMACLFVLLVLLRFTGQVGIFSVPTNAMAPFLRKGDTIIVQALTLHGQLPQRGEVVTFTTEGISQITTAAGKPQMYVKRVVGLPGDKLQFIGGILHINDRPVQEYYDVSHITYVRMGNMIDLSQPYTVPADHLVTLGDNSANSFDSRFWGPLPVKNLRHKYSFHFIHGPPLAEEQSHP